MKNFNKYIISALTISSLLAPSCQDGGSIEEKFGEYVAPEGKKIISINANAGAASRVAVSEDSGSWSLAWEDGDKMGAWCGDSDLVEFGATDVASDGSSANFSGEVSTDVTSARFIYPFDDSAYAVSSGIYDIDLTSQSVIYTNNNKFEAIGDVIPMVSSDVVDLSSDSSYDVTMSQVSALVNLMVKFTNIDAGYHLINVMMGTTSSYSFKVPFKGSINLSESVTSSEFYDDLDSDNSVNISIADSPVITEGYIIELPISVFPFEFPVEKELLFNFYLKNDSGDVISITARVGNNTDAAINLERGEVTNLGVVANMNKADDAEPLYFDIRNSSAAITEIMFSHFSNGAVAGGYIIQESAMYPDEVDIAYVKANLTEVYTPENGEVYIESMHNETVYNLKEATEYTIYGYAVDMAGNEEITEATVIATKSQPKIEITIGEVTHESIQFTAVFDADDYDGYGKIRYEVRSTEYSETSESNIVGYGDYITSNQLYTKTGLEAETEYYVTVVGLVKGAHYQYVKAQKVVKTAVKPIVEVETIEKQYMSEYSDFSMGYSGNNPMINLFNDEYQIHLDIKSEKISEPKIPTGTYEFPSNFWATSTKITRKSDSEVVNPASGSVTIALSSDGIYTISGSFVTAEGEGEMNNKSMEFEFVGAIPYSMKLKGSTALYYKDESRLTWEYGTASSHYMEMVIPTEISDDDLDTTITMESGRISSAFIQSYIGGELAGDDKKYEFAKLSFFVEYSHDSYIFSKMEGVTKEGYAIKFEDDSYLYFDPADIYIEPINVDLTGVISASGSGYLDYSSSYYGEWNTTYKASFSSDYFSELSVDFREQETFSTTGETNFPTGTFVYGTYKDRRVYSLTATPRDGSEISINNDTIELVSTKSGSEYTIVISFKLDNGAEYNLKYVGEISNYTSTISE